MEPITLVVAALVAAATTGATKLAETAVADAYTSLKDLVVDRLRKNRAEGTLLVERAADSDQSRTALERALVDADVDQPVIDAARRLLGLLESRGGKYAVDASRAKGVIIGDHGVQHNTFHE
ncbi:hypothetical protein Ais01nite_47620 [Asanoa ishikariensis]|uniref:RHIM domain-containing protein n=1 Tax=Asanoa ishikariensis TaxID=137265 RepID=A0A1H3RYA1_9ACTN|nr:hypothetical protein [Asanoa ishikariensis]GIF66727.1 hypothetical protein Ais01nite_47620 [Asanoa ishikariensis]SDZ30241.1 hypothetical protein SAMN05421684_4322 [Asanoa ishikariensis]